MRPEGKYKNNINLLLLSRYLAKTFHWEHLWKAVQPSAKHFYSVQQMALMLLTVAIFFNYVISFQLGLAVPLFCRPAERRPTKHQEEPSVGEVFFFFLERGGACGTGTWRLVCVSGKAAFTAWRMRTKTCCRISLSLTWVTFACSGKQNWPLQWLTLMQQFAFGNFIPPDCDFKWRKGEEDEGKQWKCTTFQQVARLQVNFDSPHRKSILHKLFQVPVSNMWRGLQHQPQMGLHNIIYYIVCFFWSTEIWKMEKG